MMRSNNLSDSLVFRFMKNKGQDFPELIDLGYISEFNPTCNSTTL